MFVCKVESYHSMRKCLFLFPSVIPKDFMDTQSLSSSTLYCSSKIAAIARATVRAVVPRNMATALNMLLSLAILVSAIMQITPATTMSITAFIIACFTQCRMRALLSEHQIMLLLIILLPVF